MSDFGKQLVNVDGTLFEANAILRWALTEFGEAHQVGKAIEELAELIVELARHGDPADWTDATLGELADCEIMLAQLRMMLSEPEQYESIRAGKLERLARMLYSCREV